MGVSATSASDKALNDRQSTSDNKRLLEEEGASSILIAASEIFGEAFDPDPAVELAKPTPKIQQRTLFSFTEIAVPGGSSLAWRAEVASIPLRDWIPDKLGAGYLPRFFQSDDTEIFLGDQISKEFRFNSKTGILTIEDPSGLSLPPKITGFRYIGQTAQQAIDAGGGGGGAVLPIDDGDLVGGMRTVVDDTERDAIPVPERKPGMRVHVRSTGVGYKLNANLTTWDPQPLLNATSFVFRPGGSVGPNIFTDFAALWTAIQAVGGKRIIVVDGSLTGNTATIPAAAYDFDAGLIELSVMTGHTLNLADGVTMSNKVTWSGQGGSADVSSLSDSPIISAADDLTIKDCQVRALGTAPIALVAAGLLSVIVEGSTSNLLNSTSPIVTNNGAAVNVILRQGATLGDQAIDGASGTLTVVPEESSASFALPPAPNFSGTAIVSYGGSSSSVGYTPSVAGDWLFDQPVNILEALDSLRVGRRPAELGDFLVVDTENGDDDNIGDVDSAGNRLFTMTEAIARWWPAHLSTPSWSSDTVKHMLIKFTPGMAPILENVIKPEHIGGGQLLMEFEQNVVHSGLVQSGPISAPISGATARRTVSFTGTPFVASTLGDGKFITPVDDQVQPGSNNVAFIHQEHSAIIDNTTSTLDACFVGPGSFLDAFSYGDGAAMQVVEDQIPWGPAPIVDEGVTGFGPYPVQFTNMGGMCVIKGPIIDRTLTGTSSRHPFIVDYGLQKSAANDGRNTILTMAHIRNTASLTEATRSLMISGSYLDAGSSLQIRNVDDLALERCHFTGPSGEFQLVGCGKIYMRANFVTRTAGSTNKFVITDCRDALLLNVDFRTDVNLLVHRAHAQVATCSFEDMGNDAIEMNDCTGIVDSCIGSSGNNSYGVRLGNGSLVVVRANNTVTGTSGDKIVGNLVRTHADQDLYDVVTDTRDTGLVVLPGPAVPELFTIDVADETERLTLTDSVYTGRRAFQRDTEETWFFDGTDWHLTVTKGEDTNAILVQQTFS